MKNNSTSINDNKLNILCNTVRELVKQGKYQDSEELITGAMGDYPHAPEPHNLMGLLLENKNDHLLAMKHFRAAWALDPTYLPARYNMDQYADIFNNKRVDAFNETDCPQDQEKDLYKTEYDENGIGHIVRRNKNKAVFNNLTKL